jgi:hypothetical protein
MDNPDGFCLYILFIKGLALGVFLLGRGNMDQQFLPYDELENYTPPGKPADAVILFHLTQDIKDDVAKAAKLQAKSVTGLLNDIIRDYLGGFKRLIKPEKKKTGRGNVDLEQLEKAKELMRKMHPEGVRAIEIANYVGCSNARARGLMDLLSEYSENNPDFLVYEDGGERSTLYFISRDDKLGIRL